MYNRSFCCFSVNLPFHEPVSTLLQLNNSYIVLSVGGDRVCRISHEGTVKAEYRTARIYRNLSYDGANNCFWATSPRTIRTIYRLDAGFHECGSVMIPINSVDSHPIMSVSADETGSVLYVVSAGRAFCVNTNGDFLRFFLTPRAASTLTSICTCPKHVFIGSRKNGCEYITKYSMDGGYLENYCFGEEHKINTIQQVVCNDQCRLSVCSNKQSLYPHICLLSACDPTADCRRGCAVPAPVQCVCGNAASCRKP